MASIRIASKFELGIAARIAGLIAILAAVLSAGCVAPKKPIVSAPTQTDRLLAAYPEIQNGRLLILADFEDEKQMSIFQLDSASNPGRLALDPGKGKPETGGNALAVALAAPNESIVITSPKQGDWFLKRDWRPYDLFMFSVESPVAGLTMEIEIVGGAGGQAMQARTQANLDKGWNQLRFDLVEVGEQVPLDDIQEIRLSVLNPPAAAATLHFDDFLLVGNQKDMFGESANKQGGLYVQNAGRHWNVGAGGRFELSFRYGQVTAAYDLASDPYRLRNLVRGTSLGPMPVVMTGPSGVRPLLSLSDSVAARQRIVEMNPVRVVVECIWQPAGSSSGPALEHWVYTIYSTGQIFVASRSASDAPAEGQTGLAVNFAWSSSASPNVSVSQPESAGNADTPAYAVARSTDSDSALLFIPFPDREPAQIRQVSDPTSRTTSLVWLTGSGSDGPATRRCQLVFASAAQLNDESARARAIDYTRPGAFRLDIGHPKTGDALRSDGYDPGSGSFLLATEDNRAKLVIEGKQRPCFAPAFEVDGKSTDQAWMYVNYLLHEPVVRGDHGQALFQIPGEIKKQIVVEPLFKRTSGE